MPTLNTELAYRVLDYIGAHPERHNQNSWIALPLSWDYCRLMTDEYVITAESAEAHCGTTACFAGWTVLLAGLAANRKGRVWYAGFSDRIEFAAAELLGLSAVQADELFSVAVSLDDVRRAVAEIFGPRPDVTP